MSKQNDYALQIDESVLDFEVSDEALEAAAAGLEWTNRGTFHLACTVIG
jgi:hypothetical protein